MTQRDKTAIKIETSGNLTVASSLYRYVKKHRENFRQRKHRKLKKI